MNRNITIEKAQKILDLLMIIGYEVTDIYEQSFRGIRKNEWALTEINVQIFEEIANINEDNVYNYVKYVTHVLKRYK